jgi:hypothetical protein
MFWLQHTSYSPSLHKFFKLQFILKTKEHSTGSLQIHDFISQAGTTACFLCSMRLIGCTGRGREVNERSNRSKVTEAATTTTSSPGIRKLFVSVYDHSVGIHASRKCLIKTTAFRKLILLSSSGGRWEDTRLIYGNSGQSYFQTWASIRDPYSRTLSFHWSPEDGSKTSSRNVVILILKKFR